MGPLKENLGTILTAIVIVLCILVSARMQKSSSPERLQAAQDVVVLDMLPARSAGAARQGADPIPQKRSSLEVRPIWGEVAGLEKPEIPKDPEPEPESEPEPEPDIPAPEAQARKAPDFSGLMKGVQAEARPQMKKAEFGSSTKGGSAGGGGGGFTRVSSFEEQERVQREAREKERQAAGPPIGGNQNPKDAAALQRVKKAIELGGAPEAMQKFGLDLPKLYQLQASGHDVGQYVAPDGTLSISDDDASAMASQLGIANAGPDKKTSDSSIRGGR